MALDIRAKGTATLTSTQVAGVTSTKEGQSYIDIGNSDTRSFIAASSDVIFGVRQAVRDVIGDIGIEWTRLTNTSARVYSSRPIPAGKSLIFDWMSIQD